MFINGATFYDNLHQQYCEIILELIDYYVENASLTQPKVHILQKFTSHQINVPEVQLNLEPIYVNVTSIEICEMLIDLTLQFLSKSIPMNVLNLDIKHSQYEALFQKILYMLESYNFNLKYMSIRFFTYLIRNYDDMVVTKFHKAFPTIMHDVIMLTDAFTTALQTHYEKGDVGDSFIEKFNNILLLLIQSLNFDRNTDYYEPLVNITTVILQYKIFSKELRNYVLSLSRNLVLDKDLISLKSMTSMEIVTVSDYYASMIANDISDSEHRDIQELLKENFFYKQVIKLISSLKYCEDSDIDDYLLCYHIERCTLSLQILQRVHITQVILNKRKQQANTYLMSVEFGMVVLNNILKIYEIHMNIIVYNVNILKNILNIILSLVILFDSNEGIQDTILELTYMQPQNNFKDVNDVKIMILNYLLLQKAIFKFKTNEMWNEKINAILCSILKVKNSTTFKQVS